MIAKSLALVALVMSPGAHAAEAGKFLGLLTADTKKVLPKADFPSGGHAELQERFIHIPVDRGASGLGRFYELPVGFSENSSFKRTIEIDPTTAEITVSAEGKFSMKMSADGVLRSAKGPLPGGQSTYELTSYSPGLASDYATLKIKTEGRLGIPPRRAVEVELQRGLELLNIVDFEAHKELVGLRQIEEYNVVVLLKKRDGTTYIHRLPLEERGQNVVRVKAQDLGIVADRELEQALQAMRGKNRGLK